MKSFSSKIEFQLFQTPSLFTGRCCDKKEIAVSFRLVNLSREGIIFRFDIAIEK